MVQRVERMGDLQNIPNEIFEAEGLELHERILNFFVASGTQSSVQEKAAWSIAISQYLASKIIERSLREHSDALVKSAEASEKYSQALVKSAEATAKYTRSLTQATWALVMATIVLVIVTVISLL